MLVALLLMTVCHNNMPATADGAANDLSSASDLAATRCQSPSDCRLFSSYCSTAPCACLSLGSQDHDPPCLGMQMSCFIDPCKNKRADCVAGACEVTQ
jgi:hypothetical protein